MVREKSLENEIKATQANLEKEQAGYKQVLAELQDKAAILEAAKVNQKHVLAELQDKFAKDATNSNFLVPAAVKNRVIEEAFDCTQVDDSGFKSVDTITNITRGHIHAPPGEVLEAILGR